MFMARPHPALIPRVLSAQARQLVSELLLKERLDVELLQAAGIITDTAAYNKRVVKINTALLYGTRFRNKTWNRGAQILVVPTPDPVFACAPSLNPQLQAAKVQPAPRGE